jgi:hypothetical protein
VDERKLTTAVVGHHIILRCPHCDEQYEAAIDDNPLVQHGLMIVPLPVPVEEPSELEQ